ncbi:hypothetical protein WJM95_32800 [Streptomyces sp. f51]
MRCTRRTWRQGGKTTDTAETSDAATATKAAGLQRGRITGIT